MPNPKIKEKKWTKDQEGEIYESWKADKVNHFDENSDKPVYSIDTPPPYVNAPVHIGQATTYVLMDMFARFKRMTGHNVLFPLGLDRNGLPIEMAVEKKFKVKLTETPREEFLELCKQVLEESSTTSTDTFLRLGISFNSWEIGKNLGNIYLTDSDDYRQLTQETFIDMWHKNLIYEDTRINNWCPGCQTTLADAEVDYDELKTKFNDIIFKVKETGEEIIIGTTRPELVCTCGMVIFNPEDERYQHLEGKTAISPVFNKEIPIKSHKLAEIDKGTGLVMMCSAGDLSDIRFFRDMNLKPAIAINKDGTMNENAGFLEGLKVKDARKKMIEELEKQGLLVKQKTVMHRTPVCERSQDPIEFIEMSEFYIKQVDKKERMKGIAKELNFYAPESRQILLDWIDKISIDWPITRRRYYATEVPLWYCKECNEPFVPPKGKYYKPWKEKPPIEKCQKCGCKEFRGEERVFDTWFDSSISPLYILKYSRKQNFFEKNSPCSLRPQGKEIIRTWLYYTLLKCDYLTNMTIFKDVWINYHILDGNGKKMSKSKGNVINPQDVLKQFGAEPFRMWTAIEGNLDKTDFRCSMDRIDGTRKTLVKLWNVARFVSMFESTGKNPKLNELDQWILKEVNGLVEISKECYSEYNFHKPAINIKHFLWETFSSHYLELVKNRAYNPEGNYSEEEQEGAIFTLNKCLKILLKLLAPILPMLTYKLYKGLNDKDIHIQQFPEKEEHVSKVDSKKLIELNSSIWKEKKDNGLSLRSEIKRLILTEEFKIIEKDLIAAHNVIDVSYGNKIKIEL